MPLRIDRITSHALAGNPLGDPAERDVVIYLPAAYEREPTRRFPTVLFLVGYTGTARSALNVAPWTEAIDQRMDRLIADGRIGPMILVAPDCCTSLGGSQYLDSSATGRYENFLVSEVIEHADRNYRTINDPRHRAIMGKSSGGYGAFVQALRHPELFGAVACHSGDAGFEHCYLPDFARFVQLMNKHGTPSKFLAAVRRMPKKSPEVIEGMNILAMAAAYSPNPENPELGIDLPFDLYSGQLREEVWQRWLNHDPVRMVAHGTARENLRRLGMIYIDCGTKDEYRLFCGARMLSQTLSDAGIDHIYEEFDDDHKNVQYRYDVSLPRIWQTIQ
jgi:enterochelin esterase family protein